MENSTWSESKNPWNGKGAQDQSLLNNDTYKTRSNYSIKVDGRELNPRNYVLGNIFMKENIKKLYKKLVEELGHDNFDFIITGGDRYIDENGKVRSSTNNKVIQNSTTRSPHLIEKGARAVDLRIKNYDTGEIIPVEIVKIAQSQTEFIFDNKAMPDDYEDKHFHLQLPKLKKFGG